MHCSVKWLVAVMYGNALILSKSVALIIYVVSCPYFE